MFRKIIWRGILATTGKLAGRGRQATIVLAVMLALVPASSFGQDYAPPDTVLPFPLYSTRPEDGGFYMAGGFAFYRWTNPLKDQLVAVRGFYDMDGSIRTALNARVGNPTPGTPGGFIGSRIEALNVRQVSGPNDYQPGFTLEAGWKFADQSAVTLRWMYLTQRRNTAVATLIPGTFQLGPDLEDSFLTSFVYNYPTQYAGPPDSVGLGNDFAAYGIWNGASLMTLDFVQRVQEWDITYRVPLSFFETENYRLSGTVGPRFVWLWERFKWTTTNISADTGIDDPSWVGIYTNIISNRMYGLHAGFTHECYLGHGFAAMLDVEGAFYMNIVKERAKYELGAKFLPPAHKRASTEYTLVPGLRAMLSLMWYPIEGVQMRFGYDFFALFNTVSSPRPIDYDYGALTPPFETSTIRFFDGFQASIAFVF